MLSQRANWQPALNRLATAREDRLRRGDSLLDLTISNPTRAGLPYPLDELADVMARAAREPYDPQPLGLETARDALAHELGCDPRDVVITASTSEAYSFLFKLLTDPGDEVALAVPSYPLLDHLATLEMISIRQIPMELHRRWELHLPPLASRTRAIVVVSPNNPTGSLVSATEWDALAATGLPVILDEVFRDYLFDHVPAVPCSPLTFSLGGLSKSAGLPHYKLGWIRVSGDDDLKRRALSGLELIADSFLSVSTPVQAALPDLFRIGRAIRASIQDRVRQNLDFVRTFLTSTPSIEVLPVDGGWSSVLRLAATMSDEDLALALLERGVVVHPGYFFDFATDGFVVISLLTPPDTLDEGLRRLVEVAAHS